MAQSYSGPRSCYQNINATGQVSVTSSGTQIIAANANRGGILIYNTDSTNAVFIGGANVTASNGHELPAGQAISLPYQGSLYGIVASASVTVSYIELQ